MALPQQPKAALTTHRLPPLSSLSFWNDAQWAVMFSLLEAAVPSIATAADVSDKRSQVRISDQRYAEALQLARNTLANPPSEESFKKYLEYSPLSDPLVVENATRTLCLLADANKKNLGGALSLLGTRVGAFLLTGYCTPVHEQPVHIRESILKGWVASRLTFLRVLAKSMFTLSQKAFVQASPLFRELTFYTDVPQDHKSGDDFDFNFIQFQSDSEPAVIETDVIVVGSGCGGAVCAKLLAEAGHKVLVVDKSYYFSPSHLPMAQDLGCQYLFENSGFLTTDDACVNIVAGSCWGGGGTVNWSVSLQTQDFVRKEWAAEGKLPFFTSAQFQDSLDRVSDFMGVSTENIRHNHQNKVMLEGSKKLGWHAEVAPQNAGGKEHYCGRCHLGCGSAGKQGPAVSWLPAAAKAGARFIEGFEVEKVTFVDEAGGSKHANGVIGRWISRDAAGSLSGPLDQRVTRDVVVKAKKVIISCGSLRSPLVLMKSGLTNPHIGKNLHVHPSNFVAGYWKDDIKPWEGGIITSYCSSFENLDSAGHGVKLETTCMLPYAILATLPWRGGLDFKLSALRYSHLGGFISLTRDRDTGRVYPDPISGRPRVAYTMSDFDRAHTLEGVIALAKLCYVTGAMEIHAYFPGLEPFVREPVPLSSSSGSLDEKEEPEDTDLGVDDPRFTAWLARVRQVGNKPPVAIFNSAHQMGTCRMAATEAEGVVDPDGRVWGSENLFVADASVFPSASGVNPMLTNMAIADWIAAGVAKELKSGK